VGSGVAIYPKLNMEDGFAGGLTLEESVQVARWIEQDGSVDALQLTGGHTTRTPMFLMRGDVPLREMVRYERDWVRKLGLALLGSFMIRGYPWSEAFFLASARRFKASVDLPIMLLGGVTELETMNRAIGEGFAFVALGRALIANPDLIRRMQAGELSRSICNHCNQCVAEMEREEGVRCVLHGSPQRSRPAELPQAADRAQR